MRVALDAIVFKTVANSERISHDRVKITFTDGTYIELTADFGSGGAWIGDAE